MATGPVNFYFAGSSTAGAARYRKRASRIHRFLLNCEILSEQPRASQHPGVTVRSAGRWFANYLNLPKPQPRRPREPQLPSSVATFAPLSPQFQPFSIPPATIFFPLSTFCFSVSPNIPPPLSLSLSLCLCFSSSISRI